MSDHDRATIIKKADTLCDCCEEQKATMSITHTVDLCHDCAVEWGWEDE